MKIWLVSATTSEIVENAGEGILQSSSRKWNIMKKRGFKAAVQGFKLKYKSFPAIMKFSEHYLIHQASVRITGTRVSQIGSKVLLQIGRILLLGRKLPVSSILSMENFRGR